MKNIEIRIEAAENTGYVVRVTRPKDGCEAHSVHVFREHEDIAPFLSKLAREVKKPGATFGMGDDA